MGKTLCLYQVLNDQIKIKLLYLFQEEWEVLRILALMVPAQIGFTALNSHIFTLVISKSEKYTHQDVED